MLFGKPGSPAHERRSPSAGYGPAVPDRVRNQGYPALASVGQLEGKGAVEAEGRRNRGNTCEGTDRVLLHGPAAVGVDDLLFSSDCNGRGPGKHRQANRRWDGRGNLPK